ncbi:TPA: zinc ribbon domain-containing protein [Providencia alcalifaciens]
MDRRLFVAVNPKNTSCMCLCCGYIAKENCPRQADFECVKCGYKNNADVVEAMNILREGDVQPACEVNYPVISSKNPPKRSRS